MHLNVLFGRLHHFKSVMGFTVFNKRRTQNTFVAKAEKNPEKMK
jgi:hypothetical protein